MSATSEAVNRNKSQIRFRDLVQREEEARIHLKNEKERLEQRKRRTLDEEKDLERIKNLLERLKNAPKRELAYPVYVATRDYFNANEGLIGNIVLNHEDGHLRIYNEGAVSISDIVKISLVLGLLAIDEVQPPRLIVEKPRYIVEKPKEAGKEAVHIEIFVDLTDPVNNTFSNAFFAAFGEVTGILDLAIMVLPILANEGDPASTRVLDGAVDTAEFAYVIRCLREKGIDVNEPQLKRRVNECLDKIQKVGVDKPLSDVGISLPDLNEVSDYQIQSENVRLMGPVICSAMFEELKVFQVIDKLVELSQNGMLPTGRGEAGEMLYLYWKDTPNRISESERHNIYALTIGIPGGDTNIMTNRDFNDLWLRFVSAVSSLVRQKTADQILRANIPSAISQQLVRKAARDLALNLSSKGYGMTLYLALDLQAQIKMMIKLLSDKEIRSSYGARDMWQVIDQVATLELGGARNSARYRTLATCGAIITAWLANNVKKYNSATSRAIIDIDEVLSSDPATAPDGKATTEPTDYDLVNACELWLAETATSEDQIEQLSQNPRESPMMTSRPVQIPAIAREMLDQAGIGVPGFGLGMGMRRQ